MRDGQTNDEQPKIELLSQWKLEAEFRNYVLIHFQYNELKNKASDIENILSFQALSTMALVRSQLVQQRFR